ncbi:cellulase family glycosylhydrolase [Mangrovivirga sp. M17]|uniref:mannan endo-1,4-beta-mannosidase n=1 Tax=Mangrovivirga halotolerans TaxID=2993936 RepID=A0ABT3RL12_9BACT|nr:cellulase family glycosylhydrolase [Mangrovivirga halotolerans]MCX2742261.1 cellulase family glycosylhydrolase [Mangrovivirga halotolerans]
MKFNVFLILFLINTSFYSQEIDFIRVDSGHFYQGKEKYSFLGANYWYGMYLGMESGPGDRDRLIRELDHLKSLGIKNLRILGSSEGSGMYQITPALLVSKGKYNEAVFKGLDYFLNEIRKRDMTAVVVLNNFWMWSGGMPQYISWAEGTEIPLPDIEKNGTWEPFINYSLLFYDNKKAQRLFRKHLRKIVNRRNTISGIKYKNDPTILSWQLANEPRGYNKKEEYRVWIKTTSDFLDRIDGNHMISLGAEGDGGSERDGIDLYKDNHFEAIDYATIHLWIQNWGWYDPYNVETFSEAIQKAQQYLDNQLNKAAKLKKPVVIEEFGVSRDNADFSMTSPIHYRNKFYEYLFDYTYKNIKEGGLIQGCNFWSWGGEGKASEPGGMWGKNSDLIGDPPHERQGWYSVYDHDTTTIKIINEYAIKINELVK